MKFQNKSLAAKICRDVNSILLKNKITEFRVYPKTLMQLNHGSQILWFEPCPFKKYFYSKHVGSMKNIFAYKKARRFIDMLVNDELHLTNLILNEGNDPSEFAEVFQRSGALHQFIPDDYCSAKNNCTNAACKNHFWLNNNSGKLPIDEYRENVFIFCFTATFNKKNHWFEYADQDRGVCVEYDLEIADGIFNPLIHYGRVHYDTGYDFEFVKEINYFIRRKYNKSITPTGITKLAMMYKRAKFSWEEELRISIDQNDSNIKSIIQQSSQISIANGNVLHLKNGNQYMNWKIRRVILGGRISAANAKKIIKICSTKGIPVEK